MSSKKTEFVVVHESIIQSWLRDASTLALIVASIGIGVLLDSAAMQWLGAVLAFLVIVGRGLGSVKRMTKDEAKKYLDSLD